jgi:hypothetical protein
MPTRRYEILLPLRTNDGQDVGREKFEQTVDEILNRFSGISIQPTPVHGIWVHQGRRYEDDSLRICVDVPDSRKNQQFFVKLRSKLVERFAQIEIYIVSYPVNVL